MALPREPRQKMINVMYLVLTAILALNVSNEVINAFKVVDKSLITSNINISASNNTLYNNSRSLNSGLFSHTGKSAESTSFIDFDNFNNSGYTDNPFGSNVGLCYGSCLPLRCAY